MTEARGDYTPAARGGWGADGPLAFVCPRYGKEVLGGAEIVVRQMAERLVAADLPVEVLTTCAIDHSTWANDYPEGPDEVNGVPVMRFPIERGSGRYHWPIGERVGAGLPVSLEEQELWLNDGFRSARLYHHLMETHDAYHTIVFTPYMFWTTYACSQIAPHKSVLRPCLHDEPFARLEIYRPQFANARGIMFNTPPEAELAQQLFDLPDRWEVVGEGLEIPDTYDADRFRSQTGIDRPFVLYTGRREWGKNVDMLADLFATYIARTGRDVDLVLAGRGEVVIPAVVRDRVHDLGYLDDQTMHDALAAATVVVQPSLWESFSRLVMEAWLASTPVLAYGACAVSAYHVKTSGGGLVFDDADTFEAALDLLLDSAHLRSQMAANGRAYVLDRYTWDTVLERFVACVRTWAEHDLSRAHR